MFNLNDDETLCRLCWHAPAQMGSVFCSGCDKKPATDDLPDGMARVVIRAENGQPLYEALVDTTGDVNAQVKAMFQALADAGHPLIQTTFTESEN